ncbi:unnamed protein product [Phytophthora fragariaefolia]|uniref:Unnamed protein product n=1 Tax=Phytophthora fragariaefolia TaxID=1490495 RepID=A0A9W7D6H4_9STRA|nr:unnamed protein product [Phytophthora fragariaefolia]
MSKRSMTILEKPKSKVGKQKLTISTAPQQEDTALITSGSAITQQAASSTDKSHRRERSPRLITPADPDESAGHERGAPSLAPQGTPASTGSTTGIARTYGGGPGDNSSSSSPSDDNHSDSSRSSRTADNDDESENQSHQAPAPQSSPKHRLFTFRAKTST